MDEVITLGRKGYSFQVDAVPDKTRLALAKGKDLPVSMKDAREICNAIMEQGMMLKEAIQYLNAVLEEEAAVPFKRFHKHAGHRKGLDLWKWDAGRFPKKAAKAVKGVLNNALNNARFKGLDEEKLRILLIAAHPGEKIRQRPDRRGRGGYRGTMTKRGTNIECSVIEIEEEV